ncbi:MAG: nitrite/sulfite reductase [Chloroflexi bacterium]|uniref:Nitrite/sulfite reductase n=1 Tax=Candidatus Chlorohelix allophototropha TaxID=3003348 RepID=A0A8T7M432_9CHLR|nr:nitrite/sulfite reductase [Chloroflexota bacterium]WJW70172.1 nitrite/sulfite reductase [Chloroflexota bacterium L227-S17]
MSFQETPAPSLNKMERIKKEKNPFEVWADIERYAETGFESIQPDDFDRFKWYGLYTQRPQVDGYFMLRVKIPNGDLTSQQLKVIAALSEKYGRGLADITDRQNVQYHWLRIEAISPIDKALAEVGLSLKGSCGDTVRNIIGSPLADCEQGELIDSWAIVQEVNAALCGKDEFSDLPRKFKISISGSADHWVQHEINDIGLVGIKHPVTGEVGFDVWVGGGLGAQPHLGKRIKAFIRPEQVVEVCYQIATIFRDFGYRRNRKHARLKYLVADWGAEKFRQVLEERLGYALIDNPDYEAVTDKYRDYVGVTPQKQPGLFAVGLATLRGRVNAAQLQRVAELAEQYADGHIRTTSLQNLVILNVPEANVAALREEVRNIDLPSEEKNYFRRGAMACTGIQFCKEAVAETKDITAEIVSYLQEQFPDWNEPLSINTSGCPNSCTRYQIADIGLLGSKVRQDGSDKGEKEEVYQIYLGGQLGAGMRLGHHLKRRVPVAELKTYLEGLLRRYLETRLEDENFSGFIHRHNLEELESW